MAAELPRPGVEVIQQFRTVSPTVVTPTLVPCIIGACKQIVDATVQSATGGQIVNTAALVTLPAVAKAIDASGGPPKVYTLNGSLKFRINGQPLITAAFISGTYTPTATIAIINAAITAAGEVDAFAEVVGDGWRLRTVGNGDNQSISIDSTSTAGVLTAFGFLSGGETHFGAGSYGGWQVVIPTSSFPDPRSNLAELAIDAATVRAFLGLGTSGSLLEALRTTALLRKGGAVAAIDDGNGDNLTPFVQMAGEDFTSLVTTASAATVTGTDAITFGALDGETLIISDGRAPVTITFAAPGSAAVAAAQIQAAFNAIDGLTAVVDGGNHLVLTSTRKREDGSTAALGEDSEIVIYGGSSVQPVNNLDPNVSATVKIARYVGRPQAAVAGDELWVDGVFVGRIVQVAPGANNARLKLDTQVATTFTGLTFYIVGRNLNPLPGGLTTRPAPNAIVDAIGNVTLKLGILRDTTGKIVESITTTSLIPARAPMYVSYKALRLDVTQKASNPGLLKINDTIQLGSLLDPVSPDNPLALGLYFALLNGPAIQVTGLGVDAISATEPFGTLDAFTRAASYLESFEVYGLVPLTHEDAVHQVFKAHVDTMSAPENKGERICLINPAKPVSKLNILVSSGVDGNSVGNSGLSFDIGVGNLAALLLARGIDPTVTIPVSAGLFLNIAENTKNYSISAISGSVVTIRIVFTPGQNDDGFYSTTDLNDPPLPAALISEPFAVRIRGLALVLTDGSPDKDGIADTYSGLGQTYLDRRVWMTAPDKCKAIVAGLEQLLEGFYMNAGIAGMIGQQPPQQSFTNFPMTGFTGVDGSNNFFTEKQMNRMAGGGTYIIVQDVEGAPLISRMALTTDTTSIETRTDSITKVVDFAAKFYRRGLKNFIGRFNITQGFLDSLGHVLEGLSSFLKEAGVLIGAHINNIVQDENAPDMVLVDITLDVPFPCNYIRVTLTI